MATTAEFSGTVSASAKQDRFPGLGVLIAVRRALADYAAQRALTQQLLRMPPHLIRDIGHSVEDVEALRRQSQEHHRTDIERRRLV